MYWYLSLQSNITSTHWILTIGAGFVVIFLKTFKVWTRTNIWRFKRYTNMATSPIVIVTLTVCTWKVIILIELCVIQRYISGPWHHTALLSDLPVIKVHYNRTYKLDINLGSNSQTCCIEISAIKVLYCNRCSSNFHACKMIKPFSWLPWQLKICQWQPECNNC